MKPANGVVLVTTDDERVTYIDERLEAMVDDVTRRFNLDPLSVVLIAVSQIGRQLAYASIEDASLFYEAAAREIRSNYRDVDAQRDRIAAGNRLRDAMSRITSQVCEELEEARSKGRVS